MAVFDQTLDLRTGGCVRVLIARERGGDDGIQASPRLLCRDDELEYLLVAVVGLYQIFDLT